MHLLQRERKFLWAEINFSKEITPVPEVIITLSGTNGPFDLVPNK
jgi:hypothetical protein